MAWKNARPEKPLLVALLLVLLVSLEAFAQPFSVIQQPMIAWIQAQKHAAPGSLGDFDTGRRRHELFRQLVSAMAEQEWPRAGLLSQQLRYRLVIIHEDGGSFVAATDDSGHGIDPILIVNLRAKRDVILQAPHVPYEKGTAEQAIILLKELGARAVIISGAHRCASKSFTMCNGVTAVCSNDGRTQAFRASDAGHNTQTLFHAAHIVLAETWKKAVVISLHGMSNDKDGVVTSFIISNGIQANDTDRSTPATRLRYALAKTVTRPGGVVSCNERRDSRFDYRPLCGFTNVQGRHVNGDTDACRNGVTRGTGRFIHIEQDLSVLAPYFEDWQHIHRYAAPSALSRSLQSILPDIRD